MPVFGVICEYDPFHLGHRWMLEQLWGYDYLGDTRTVDVHMRRLRQKIEDEPSSPKLLKTVHGIGYKFQFEDAK